MQEVKLLRDADIKGKRVLVRCDFDVDIEGERIVEDTRLKSLVPTIEFLHKGGASGIVLIGHIGRPDGKVDAKLRIEPVAKHLRTLTAAPFEIRENLRFDPREEANDEGFAKELASLGDMYVNEAFADSHRAHASIVGVPKFLPKYIGLRFEEEIKNLSQALTPPEAAIAIIGGAKFETKTPLIEKLLAHYSKILIGGALGSDMLRSRGLPVGASLISSQPVPTAIAGEERVLAPTDVALLDAQTNMGRTTNIADVRAGEKIVDIGPLTTAAWAQEIAKASFVVWNGPMGVYEKGFVEGTEGLAHALASSQAHAVVGGGDTIAALTKVSFDPQRIFISTGGGAMLEFLTAGTLVGLEALK